MASLTALTADQLQIFLDQNPHWFLENSALTREWTFPGFSRAIAFVNRVAEAAEAANHHPDIDIRYSRVRLALVTHDAGGITTRDTALARQVQELA